MVSGLAQTAHSKLMTQCTVIKRSPFFVGASVSLQVGSAIKVIASLLGQKPASTESAKRAASTKAEHMQANAP